MTVDPTDPDTFVDDAEVREFDEESPEADAAEQLTDLNPHRDAPLSTQDPGTANIADVVEQTRIVEIDEDDYR
jgi:hypothetical protein